ncbi:MAG TPA: hypothetical protein VGY54_06580, partial [Polyangiaceae bacterium]|nr:hypothetical protein [Polyangiaceae bacterium]
MTAFVFPLPSSRWLRGALHLTALAIAACGGQAISNGAASGRGGADASTDSSAAQAIDASAPTVQDAGAILDAPTVDNAAQPDAAPPNIEPLLDASPVPLDGFGGRQTLSVMSCGLQDAQAVQSPPACPCNGAVTLCALPDAGAAECTSTDLHGQTCETLGFTGGTLGCNASCSFDTSGCDSCVAGPHTACASPHVADGLADVAFALAASDTEIGLAWGDRSGTVHFTRFGSDLTLLSDNCITTPHFDALSLASNSSGWMIAAHGYEDSESGAPGDQLLLYPLDHAGKMYRSNQVLSVARDHADFAVAYFRGGPTLSSLSGGDRLLLSWVEDFYFRCLASPCPYLLSRVLVNDGSTVVSPDGGDGTLSPGGETYGTSGRPGRPFWAYSSVAVEDGFAVETTPQGLSHVAFDGTLRATPLAPSTTNTNVKLAWSGSELRLLYQTLGEYSVRDNSYGPGMAFLQRI